MIRRAEWRRLPKDPRTLLGWCLYESRGTTVALAVTFGFFGFCAVMAVQLGLPFVFFLCFIATGIFVYLTLLFRNGFRFESISALAAKPEPAETFPVEFLIFRERVCTGRDRGIATMVDGWLHIEGLHTTFSIRPVDIVGTSFDRESRGGLVLVDGQTVLFTSMQWGRARREAFAAALRSWRHFPFELPKGEPLMPPRRVHGSAISRPVLILGVSLITVIGSLGVLMWLFLTPGVGEFSLITIAFMVAYVIFQTKRQISYLIRLRNLEHKALAESTET